MNSSPDFIQRIFAFVTMQALRVKASRWFAKRFKYGTFELHGDVIVEDKGKYANQRVSLDSIRSWKVYPEMGFDVVTIELLDGSGFNWFDTYNDLIGILETRVPERKRDWQKE